MMEAMDWEVFMVAQWQHVDRESRVVGAGCESDSGNSDGFGAVHECLNSCLPHGDLSRVDSLSINKHYFFSIPSPTPH